jgi:hypothetical protein
LLIYFYEGLLKALNERKALCTDRIISGVFESFEEYKLFVGKLKGLKESEEVIREAYKKMNEPKPFMEERRVIIE